MIKMTENTNVADNTIIINGIKFTVTDDIAQSVYDLIKGVKPSKVSNETKEVKPSKKYTFKDRDIKWSKPVKVDGGYAFALDGYVNTLAFRYIAECLKDSSKYVKGLGFIFTKKSEGEKLTSAITKVTAAQQEGMMR